MKFILIYWLMAQAGIATGSTTFDDEASCKGALAAVAKSWPGNLYGVPGVCVPASSEEDVAAAPPSAPVKAVAPTRGIAPTKPNG